MPEMTNQSNQQKPNQPKPKPKLNNNEYQCAVCENVYEKSRTDQEAIDECAEVFGVFPEEMNNLAIICDDCWIALGFDDVAKKENKKGEQRGH